MFQNIYKYFKNNRKENGKIYEENESKYDTKLCGDKLNYKIKEVDLKTEDNGVIVAFSEIKVKDVYSYKIDNTNYDSLEIKNTFEKLKDFYYEKFTNIKILNEIVDRYIAGTNKEKLFEPIRVRILSMYLFNKAISKEKYSQLEMINIVKLRIQTESNDKVDNISSDSLEIKNTFKKLKDFYYEKFTNIKMLNEIIDRYIAVTNKEKLFEPIRVRILSMYLFNKAISKEKYSQLEMINIVKLRIQTESNDKVDNNNSDSLEIKNTFEKLNYKTKEVDLKPEDNDVILAFPEIKVKDVYYDRFINIIKLRIETESNDKVDNTNSDSLENKNTFEKLNYKTKEVDLKPEDNDVILAFPEIKVKDVYYDRFINIIKLRIENVSNDKRNNINSDSLENKNTFEKLKNFYCEKFTNIKILNDIIDRYIAVTNKEKLFEPIRVRILSMYLFNKGISKEKYAQLEMRDIIELKLVKSLIIDDNIDNNEVYQYMKSFIDNNIQLNINISLDSLLIILIFKMGYYVISKDSVVNIVNDVVDKNEDFNEEISFELIKLKLNNVCYVDSIIYWQSDEGKQYTCSVIFNNRDISIFYEDGIIYKTLVEKGPINVTTANRYYSEEKKIYLYISDERFILNSKNKDIVLSYYENVNSKIKKEMIKDFEFIDRKLDNVPQNIIELIKNYIKYSQQFIFLKSEAYRAFEHLISCDNYYMRLKVDIDDNRDDIIDYLNNNNNLYKEVVGSINEYFNKLVKISGKYIFNTKEINASILWSLIKRNLPQYYSQVWSKDKGVYFGDISSKSIDELVATYCRLDTIEQKDSLTMGEFTYYLMYNKKLEEIDNFNFIKCNIEIINKILNECENVELERFESRLTNSNVRNTKYSLNDVDMMSGYEFEDFISKLFKKMGYSTSVTKRSGDQGIDVIVEKGDSKIGVQAKCYSGSVGNKAIQETVAGLRFYNCNKGLVVTNNYFTKSAVELAQINDIVLWDRTMLKQKINELF